MVNITAMLSNLPAGPVSDIARPQSGETPGIEGFTQLLALQMAGLSPDAAPLAAPLADTAPALPAASVLPDSGNILPVGLAALPGGLPGALAEEMPSAEEPAAEPVPTALPAFPALLSLPIIPLALAAPQGESKAPVMPQAKPLDAPQIAPTAAAPAEAAAAQRLLPVTSALPAELAAAQAVSLAPLILPAAASATFQVQVRPRGTAAAPSPAAGIEIAAALATAAQTAPATLDLLRPKAAAGEALPVTPLTPALSATPFDAAPAQNAPVTAPTQPAQPVHDFAALVDRLVEARDAIRPQSIEAAITTAEFGQVALRFAADDAGLSVTMASADPEFARAAQAAQAVAVQSATVQPATQTQSGSDASAQGQSAAPHSEQRGQGQSGSQPRERLADERLNNRNAPRGEATDDSPQRSGIFA